MATQFKIAKTDYVDDLESRLNERIKYLEENQITGVKIYPTLANLPAIGTLLVSYKVSNDTTPSNNGYYHWNGSTYIKDASLASGTIAKGDVEPISGGTAYEALFDQYLSIVNGTSDFTGYGLTVDSIVNGLVNITKSSTYAWMYADTKKYQFVQSYKARYLVLAVGASSVLALTIDNSANSGNLYRWTSSTFTLLDSPSYKASIIGGDTIKAIRDDANEIIKIYVNDILTYTVDYGARSESEWSNVRFGNAFTVTGEVISELNIGYPSARLDDVESRLDALQYGLNDTTKLNGGTLATLGDSLEDQEGMQPIFCARFGMTYTNYGVSGKTIIDKGTGGSVVDQVEDITGTPTIIYIGGGVNDFGKNSPLGDLNSTDTSEFYGALNYICNYLITNFPNSLIIGSTIPFGDWQTPGNANGQVNNIGLTRDNYAYAQRQVYKTWGIHYIDQLQDLDWNLQNILSRTSDRLHPNITGSTDRSNLLAKLINTLY